MAGPGGKALRYLLPRSFMRWSIRPGTFSFARFDRGADVRVTANDQRRFLLSVCATRAFTNFLTSAMGRGLFVGNWMVPLDVEKGLSSFLNFSIIAAVGNKLQCSEKAANHTSTPLCLKAGIR